MLLPCKCRQIFLAKRGGVLAGQGRGFSIVFGGFSSARNIQRLSRRGKQSFALENGEEVTVKSGVHLQAVASVFHDVRVDESRHDALLEQSFAQTLREGRGAIKARTFGFAGGHGAKVHMVAAVEGFDCWPRGREKVVAKNKRPGGIAPGLSVFELSAV